MDDLVAAMPPTPAGTARIPVRREDGIDLVCVAEITWAEAAGDYVHLHTGNTIRTVRETLAELEATLRPFGFLRVHRSAIVNADAVRSVDSVAKGDYVLTLRDGTRVRSGRRYRAVVQSLIRAPSEA